MINNIITSYIFLRNIFLFMSVMKHNRRWNTAAKGQGVTALLRKRNHINKPKLEQVQQ